MTKSLLSGEFDLQSPVDDRGDILRALKIVLGGLVRPFEARAFITDPMWRARYTDDLVVNPVQMQKAGSLFVHLEDQIRATVQADQARLSREQPTADWAFVAWEIVEVIQNRRARTAAEIARAERYGPAEWARENPDNPDGTPPRRGLRVVAERAWQVRFAWVDIRHNVEVDTWEIDTLQKNGVLSNVGNAKKRSDLPMYLQRQYDAARAVIGRFVEGREDEVGEERDSEGESVEVTPLDQPKIDAARQLLAAGSPIDLVKVATGLPDHVLATLTPAHQPPPAVTMKPQRAPRTAKPKPAAIEPGQHLTEEQL